MRKVQIILFNDGNADRNNRLQRLFGFKNVLSVEWPADKRFVSFTPAQLGVKTFPAYVFLAEVSTDQYFPQSVVQRAMSDQEILNEYNRVAQLTTIVASPTPNKTGTEDGKPGGKEGATGTGGPGCLLPLWLTGGKCITVPAWIWLIPAAYTGVKIIDARKNSGRIIWGSAFGYFLYRYLKDLNRK